MEILFQGESRVVSKKSGDVVFGGTVVVEGSTLMKVIACGIWQCTLLLSFFFPSFLPINILYIVLFLRRR